VISKKYLKDYRLEEQIDSNGRIKTKAVYTGGDYTITPGFPKGKKTLILYHSVLSALSFIVAIIPVSQAARTIYIIMPFVFTALTIYIMTATAVSLYLCKEKMKREQAERISNRLPACSLVTMILTGAALTGQAITAAVSWEVFSAGDMIFSISALVIFVATAVIFIKCKSIRAVSYGE